MFYTTVIKDHIRVPPDLFSLPLKQAIVKRIKKQYEGYISKDFGIVLDVIEAKEIGEGKLIAGDGAAYYQCVFELITFRPELQEILPGKIKDVADFGAFFNMGPIDGMIHVSQTMDDFVSVTKEKTLSGKETKRSIKIGDKCLARVVAASYKDPSNPKFALTMRQPGLGKAEWNTEDSVTEEPVEEKKKK
ncbi:MAG: DNA-directed RNA polymerase [Nanoarchaeota archaeon]|nr:MAG: DNA-directed RNA polymerase [Nanoarchaeota archaeon]